MSCVILLQIQCRGLVLCIEDIYILILSINLNEQVIT